MGAAAARTRKKKRRENFRLFSLNNTVFVCRQVARGCDLPIFFCCGSQEQIQRKAKKVEIAQGGSKGEVNGSDPVFPLQFRSETHFGATIDRSEVLPDAQVCDGGVGEKNGQSQRWISCFGSGVQ